MKTFDLNRAKRIVKSIQRDRMPIKNVESGVWIYYFNSQWLCIIDGIFVERHDDNVIVIDIEKHPDAIVTIVQMGIQKIIPPDVVANHKNLKTITVATEIEFVELMSDETGIEITVDDLKPKPMLPGYNSKSNPINFAHVHAIIDRICGKPSIKPRLFCAGDYPVTIAQRSFGLKIRAIILKIKSNK